MKVKAISRIEEDYTRECKSDILKVHRNLDPALHPMHRAKEYKRALNATKLDKVFAKPFIGALEGHSDGVMCLAKSPTQLSVAASGAPSAVLSTAVVSSAVATPPSARRHSAETSPAHAYPL